MESPERKQSRSDGMDQILDNMITSYDNPSGFVKKLRSIFNLSAQPPKLSDRLASYYTGCAVGIMTGGAVVAALSGNFIAAPILAGLSVFPLAYHGYRGARIKAQQGKDQNGPAAP